MCRMSLVSASDMIKLHQGKALDGALFLVRHLLILKDMLVSLESDLRSRADENGGGDVMGSTFTKSIYPTVGVTGGVTETISNMLSKTTSLLPESLFASLGAAGGLDNDLRGVKMVKYFLCFLSLV